LFRRGFKALCERLSAQFRKELAFGRTAPLCPWVLAQYLEVKISTPKEIPGLSPTDFRDVMDGGEEWSAVTICFEGRHLIILNDGHARSRQSNDLMHELAHLILGHDPSRVDVSEDNLLMLNTYGRDQEEEADWLAATLLIPRDAVMEILRLDRPLQEAARQYGISQKLLDWRINSSGARIQLSRERRS
jgi:hypothetical protein